ncbi:MAG TPA: hypothetical protein VK524_02890, partial [Polyangiaceae bacterium]|nr:hypothetical protein [Polyangiaceae bacterium]
MLATLCCAPGCGSDSDDPSGGGPISYVVASTVMSDDADMTYVRQLGALEAEEIDLATALEYPGFATIAGVGSTLFLGSGDGADITKYTVNAETLSPAGTLNFSDFGGAALYTNVFASANKAYMDVDSVKRVIWNPEQMVIEGEMTIAGLAPTRDELLVRASYDRGTAVRPGRVFHTHFWSDDDYIRYAPVSQIAVIDSTNDSVKALLDAPCPGLDVASTDDAGNIYFSNWVFSVSAQVLDENASRNCIVKIANGQETLDANFTKDLTEVTEGRPAAAFRHLAGDVAIVAVLHTEALDTSSDVEPANQTVWRLWRVHLDTWTAEPVPGLDYFSGGYYSFKVGGRTIV